MLALARQNLKRELDAAKDRVVVTEGELNNASTVLGGRKKSYSRLELLLLIALLLVGMRVLRWRVMRTWGALNIIGC